MIQDPVCLMEVEPGDAAAVSVHKGQAYYFCSDKCKQEFELSPDTYLHKVQGMRLTVGVMGSASLEQPVSLKKIAWQLGHVIVQQNFILITGACPGLPYECARGVREVGGMSIGISPALSLHEHVHKYHSPSDMYDVLVYTGSGLMGREVTNIRSSDMVIVIGGSSGTLGEFAIAYDEGKLIGVLSESGGITEQLPALVKSLNKDTGSQVVYHKQPEVLISSLVDIYTQQHYRRPSCFCNNM